MPIRSNGTLEIGASEVPYLFLDPKLLFVEEEQKTEPYVDFLQKIGLAIEPIALDYVQNTIRKELIRNPQKFLEIDSGIVLRATPDGYLEDEKIVFEVKTNIFGESDFYSHWLQVQAQMAVFDAVSGNLITVTQKGISLYEIERSNETEQEIKKRIKILHENWEEIKSFPVLDHFSSFSPKQFRDFYELPEWLQNHIEEWIALKKRKDSLSKESQQVEKRLRELRAKIIAQKGEWSIRTPTGTVVKKKMKLEFRDNRLLKELFPDVYNAIKREVNTYALTFYERKAR